jgi:hypothetical protein
VQHGYSSDGKYEPHEQLITALEGCGANVHLSGFEGDAAAFDAADAVLVLLTDLM